MTIRKKDKRNIEVGNYLKNLRLRLTDLPKSRQKFIDHRAEHYFNDEEWISEKTLGNYETGKNLPQLENINKLAIAYEIDPSTLVKKILDKLTTATKSSKKI